MSSRSMTVTGRRLPEGTLEIRLATVVSVPVSSLSAGCAAVDAMKIAKSASTRCVRLGRVRPIEALDATIVRSPFGEPT